MPSAKKSKTPDLFRLFDEGVLTEVFRWIGDGSYRPVGGTNRRFRKIYKREFGTSTSVEQLVQTIAGAKLFLKEVKPRTSLVFTMEARRIVHYDSEFMEFIADMAALHGNMEVLKWARARGCHFLCTFSFAASHGHVRILEWLVQNGHVVNLSYNFDGALYNGELGVLKWARKKGYLRLCKRSHSCAMAASGGQLEVLEWLRQQGCPWDAEACSWAAQKGHLMVLQWLVEHGCPFDETTCVGAAKNGQLLVLMWLRDHGCPWNARTCSVAAGNGHLSVLQWLREQGCPWDERTCAGAAQNGHLEVLQWARANNCRWNSLTIAYAERYGHVDIVNWAIENGCS